MRSRFAARWNRTLSWPIRRPRAALVVSGAILLAALASLATLRPNPDIAAMVRTPAAVTYEAVSRVFGLRQRNTVLLESTTPGRERDLVALAEDLTARLEATGEFERIEHGLALAPAALAGRLVFPHFPLFMDAGELETLLSPEGLRARARKQADLLSFPGLGEAEDFAERDPLGLELVLAETLGSIRGGPRIAPGSTEFLSRDGRSLLLLTDAEKDPSAGMAADARIVRTIERAAAESLASPRFAGLTVGGTGGSFIAEEAERTIRRDLILCVTGSFALCGLILSFGLRIGPLSVMALGLPTLWSLAIGAGLFALFRRDVAWLSFGCYAVVFGFGIDPTIHVTTAAFRARAAGLSVRAALRRAVFETRGPITFATLTTLAVFFAFLLTRQAFLQDMGLLTLLGFSACLVATFLILPPLLRPMLEKREPALGRKGPRSLGLTPLARVASSHPGAVLSGAALLCAAAVTALAASPLRLERDLRNLQGADSRPLEVQRKIGLAFEGATESTVAWIEQGDEAELIEACHALDAPLGRLVAEGHLASFLSVGSLVPSRARQEAALALLATKDPRALAREVRLALDEAGFDPSRFDDYVARFEATVARRRPLTVADLAEAGLDPLLRQLVAKGEGTACGLIVLQPREEIWDGAARDAHVERVREAFGEAGVEARLTGLHLISSESASEVGGDFARVSGLTASLVVAVIFFRFRTLGGLVLALLPAALAGLWTAGFCSAFDFRLNMMNLGVLPMVLALGVDSAIHILARFDARRQRDGGVLGVVSATGTGIVLSSLTTLFGFGSLALSENRGLASVGILTFVGVGSSLLASVTCLPAALALIARRERSAEPRVRARVAVGGGRLAVLVAVAVLAGGAGPARAAASVQDAAAPAAPEKEGVPPAVRAFLEAWAVELRDVRSLRVRFDQTKDLRILRRPRKSHGVAVLKGASLLMRVRNEAGETETELLVEGDSVRIHYPRLQRLEIYPADAGRKSQAPFPLSGSDVESLPRSHRLSLEEAGETRVLTLAPRDERDVCKEIRLTFRGTRLERVEQENRNGDRVRMDIAEFSVNPEIADSELRLDVPEGTRVVSIAGPGEKKE